MQANIFKIKRNELADGSGLRTTIYFKGCPLRCVWCSTPQAHERPTRILWDSKHCLYCNLCVSECPTGSLAFSDNRLTFTPDTCTFCRACTDHCPSRMLHFVGQMMDMDEIMEKILADRELYGNGGVILSGGDPLMQPEAATAVLKKCKEHGIRTAIETTAFAKPLAFSRFIANADMIIIDLNIILKEICPVHRCLKSFDSGKSGLCHLYRKKVAVRITITPASTTRSSMPAGMPTFCLSTTSDM
ncbi:MAG: glycyl-radical enzyme activating protein [Clostridium fessum]